MEQKVVLMREKQSPSHQSAFEHIAAKLPFIVDRRAIAHRIMQVRHDLARMAAGALIIVGACFMPAVASAQDSPFSGSWMLDTKSSVLSFQTVKNNAVVENSKFASFTGQIDENGLAVVKVQLDSVDTTIDLRNVRMRFLFFETFDFPEATVTAQLDAAALADLKTKRHIPYKIRFTLELHGIKSDFEVDAIVTLISDTRVSVSSSMPIPIAVKNFGMEENVRKLEDAAKVKILPSGSVSFNFVFATAKTMTTEVAVVEPKSTAVETKGNFSGEACRGRFEILSRTGAIYFRTNSAKVEADSAPFLRAVSEIAQRCPDLKIMISGHTDSDGDAISNQRLSEARAEAVRSYLADIGISNDRLRSIGYGENRPVAANDTPRNRGLNRRIEFSVFEG